MNDGLLHCPTKGCKKKSKNARLPVMNSIHSYQNRGVNINSAVGKYGRNGKTKQAICAILRVS